MPDGKKNVKLSTQSTNVQSKHRNCQNDLYTGDWGRVEKPSLEPQKS